MKTKIIKYRNDPKMLLTPLWYWTTKSGERIWKCQCKCGNTCYAKESALKNGIIKNCGCKVAKPPIRYILKKRSFTLSRATGSFHLMAKQSDL